MGVRADQDESVRNTMDGPAGTSPRGSWEALRDAKGADVLDFTMRAIQSELDGLSARQRITSQNIANAETPGYLAGRVNFEDSLAAAIANGDPTSAMVTTTTTTDPTNFNGNNVNVDDENVSLIETGLRYQLATESMNNKFRILNESMKTE
jgi:flagellar basal-body rod protein FlgB